MIQFNVNMPFKQLNPIF